MRPPLPPHLVAQAREYAEGGRTPVAPREAATVILLRASASPGTGPEIYLLHRQRSMAFAAGMAVFPGGGVDPRDFDAAVGWAGPPAVEWATRLGVDEEKARALVCAAVRETFEESGVLLAGPSPDEVVADTTGDGWEADRVALESRDLSMTEFLTRRGLVLRTDLLGVWSGWLTPEFEPRRYRTWFFVAMLPAGQRTRDVSGESSTVAWQDASGAVAEVERGDLAMMPPTYATCLEIAQHPTPDDVLAEAHTRTVDMFMPALEQVDGEWRLSMPDRLRPLVEARGR